MKCALYQLLFGLALCWQITCSPTKDDSIYSVSDIASSELSVSSLTFENKEDFDAHVKKMRQQKKNSTDPGSSESLTFSAREFSNIVDDSSGSYHDSDTDEEQSFVYDAHPSRTPKTETQTETASAKELLKTPEPKHRVRMEKQRSLEQFKERLKGNRVHRDPFAGFGGSADFLRSVSRFDHGFIDQLAGHSIEKKERKDDDTNKERKVSEPTNIKDTVSDDDLTRKETYRNKEKKFSSKKVQIHKPISVKKEYIRDKRTFRKIKESSNGKTDDVKGFEKESIDWDSLLGGNNDRNGRRERDWGYNEDRGYRRGRDRADRGDLDRGYRGNRGYRGDRENREVNRFGRDRDRGFRGERGNRRDIKYEDRHKGDGENLKYDRYKDKENGDTEKESNYKDKNYEYKGTTFSTSKDKWESIRKEMYKDVGDMGRFGQNRRGGYKKDRFRERNTKRGRDRYRDREYQDERNKFDKYRENTWRNRGNEGKKPGMGKGTRPAKENDNVHRNDEKASYRKKKDKKWGKNNDATFEENKENDKSNRKFEKKSSVLKTTKETPKTQEPNQGNNDKLKEILGGNAGNKLEVDKGTGQAKENDKTHVNDEKASYRKEKDKKSINNNDVKFEKNQENDQSNRKFNERGSVLKATKETPKAKEPNHGNDETFKEILGGGKAFNLFQGNEGKDLVRSGSLFDDDFTEEFPEHSKEHKEDKRAKTRTDLSDKKTKNNNEIKLNQQHNIGKSKTDHTVPGSESNEPITVKISHTKLKAEQMIGSDKDSIRESEKKRDRGKRFKDGRKKYNVEYERNNYKKDKWRGGRQSRFSNFEDKDFEKGRSRHLDMLRGKGFLAGRGREFDELNDRGFGWGMNLENLGSKEFEKVKNREFKDVRSKKDRTGDDKSLEENKEYDKTVNKRVYSSGGQGRGRGTEYRDRERMTGDGSGEYGRGGGRNAYGDRDGYRRRNSWRREKERTSRRRQMEMSEEIRNDHGNTRRKDTKEETRVDTKTDKDRQKNKEPINVSPGNVQKAMSKEDEAKSGKITEKIKTKDINKS